MNEVLLTNRLSFRIPNRYADDQMIRNLLHLIEMTIPANILTC